MQHGLLYSHLVIVIYDGNHKKPARFQRGGQEFRRIKYCCLVKCHVTTPLLIALYNSHTKQTKQQGQKDRVRRTQRKMATGSSSTTMVPTDAELLQAQADLWRHSLYYLSSMPSSVLLSSASLLRSTALVRLPHYQTW